MIPYATLETTTAPAAPVAPQSEPKTRISGSITAASIPEAQIRSPGRPIETGNDFDQPNTTWIAAATRMIRAAGIAGEYWSPRKNFTSQPIASSSGTSATSISAVAPRR